MDAEAARPREIARSGEADVAIEWADGHRSVYPARALRLACPCAECQEELTGRSLVADAAVPEGVRPLGIELVGSYALSVRWSDGHATGIYAFRSLREECPCEPCAKALRATITARRAR
ncbi:MAG TPA: DUF971 domain-containing protein [Candidatus Limnocylindrales bacterium]|nr:DUF971 domain-containing protein [Candidatus Limnocylindrales bacterium]